MGIWYGNIIGYIIHSSCSCAYGLFGNQHPAMDFLGWYACFFFFACLVFMMFMIVYACFFMLSNLVTFQGLKSRDFLVGITSRSVVQKFVSRIPGDKSDVLVHLACTLSQKKHGNNRTHHFSRFWMIYILKTDSFMLNGHTWAHNETLKINVRFGTCDLPRWFCYISVCNHHLKQANSLPDVWWSTTVHSRYEVDSSNSFKWTNPFQSTRFDGLLPVLVIWCYYWLNPPHFGGCTPILGCWLVKTVQSIFLL
jgi:hypothetical protein